MADKQLAWETLEEDIVYSCDGFDVLTQAVRLPGGQTTDFDYVSENPSVVILPLTPDGEVVVIEEYRQPVQRVNYGLPAGGLEPSDSDLERAVARELEEETGYRPGEIDHLTSIEPANGFADSLYHYFIARDCRPTGEQDLDEDESIRVSTTTMESLLGAARRDELRDGRALVGILYFALFEGDEQHNP